MPQKKTIKDFSAHKKSSKTSVKPHSYKRFLCISTANQITVSFCGPESKILSRLPKNQIMPPKMFQRRWKSRFSVQTANKFRKTIPRRQSGRKRSACITSGARRLCWRMPRSSETGENKIIWARWNYIKRKGLLAEWNLAQWGGACPRATLSPRHPLAAAHARKIGPPVVASVSRLQRRKIDAGEKCTSAGAHLKICCDASGRCKLHAPCLVVKSKAGRRRRLFTELYMYIKVRAPDRCSDAVEVGCALWRS